MQYQRALVRTVFLIALFSLNIASVSAQTSQHLFGLSANNGVIDQQPWPSVPFNGGIRLWNTFTAWDDMNPSDGVYNFANMDAWLQKAGANHAEVLYTFGRVPQWASQNPTDPLCKPVVGTCDPPNDLNADGSGTDQHFKNYVTALVNHNQSSTTAKIEYWEMWNEPHNNFFWNGTYAQLIRMVSDAYTIIKSADPKAVVLSPSFGWSDKFYLNYMAGYLASGGGQYADRIAVHGYVMGPGHSYGDPEMVVTDNTNFRAVLQQYGQGSKPMFDTEANWGWGLLNDPDMEAAWVSRFYLLHHSVGIWRAYWFIWNGGSEGGLWQGDPANHRNPGTLLKPGVAYQETGSWLVGALMSQKCSSQGTVWSCTLTRSGGYQALVVWDASQTCKNGFCSTTNYQFSGPYVNYLSLDGSKTPISGNTVPIGAKPILLQNQ